MLANFIQFKFKPLCMNDMPLLEKWFKQPHIKKWWTVPSNIEYLSTYIERLKSENITAFIVMCNEIPIGYIHYYPYPDTQKNVWLPSLPQDTIGIGVSIGEYDYISKGYGTIFIAQFITTFLPAIDKTIKTIIMDPEPNNSTAIKCYTKIGFVNLGVYTSPAGPLVIMRYDL